MTDLISREAAIDELALRRNILSMQNVISDVLRDLHLYDICIEAIRALPPAQEAAPAVKVKPLEWRRDGCLAVGMGIRYSMGEGEPGMFELTSPFHSEPMSQGECQAAAQSDYEARILAALEVTP